MNLQNFFAVLGASASVLAPVAAVRQNAHFSVPYKWTDSVTLQTRQSLASQVTSQIVGPEINVTFRYNPKRLGGHGYFPGNH